LAEVLNGPVLLAPYDPAWPTAYEGLAILIDGALGADVAALHHAGSTSVPGLAAKPVIDLILEVADSADEEAYVPALEAAGFTFAHREPDWFEHRLLKFARPKANLHIFSACCPETRRMLAFRDHLRRDTADRALYEETKRTLAARSWRIVQDYADAKSEMVAQIMSRALEGP
jgi:GrpB-like predicted nucleotidyltransferase (UPF0157 family)